MELQMSLEYVNIQAYRMTQKLLGKPIELWDVMAERLPCAGCGAPAGYFCLAELAEDEITPIYHSRFSCRGIIGSQNPRTMRAFARAVEEIERQEKAKK